MVRCSICNSEIETNYIGKLVGTVVKIGGGESSKKHYVCRDCQKEHKDLKKVLED